MEQANCLNTANKVRDVGLRRKLVKVLLELNLGAWLAKGDVSGDLCSLDRLRGTGQVEDRLAPAGYVGFSAPSSSARAPTSRYVAISTGTGMT